MGDGVRMEKRKVERVKKRKKKREKKSETLAKMKTSCEEREGPDTARP